MRNGVIGIVIGLVVGATVIAPRLAPSVPVSGAVPSVLKPAAGPATRVSAAENLAAAPLAPKRSPRVRWKMGSAFAAALPQLGTLAKRVDEEIWRVSGAVDATEYSMPAIDLKLGFHAMAKHYYFPGWHQPATLCSLMINMDRWEELNSARQARVGSVCGDNIRHGLAEGEALQFAALQLKGVQMHRWPDTILDALESSWQDVAVEEATADEDFKQVWESMSEFRRDYGIWKELGHPNRWAADGLPDRLVLAVPRMQSPSPWLNKVPPGRASAS